MSPILFLNQITETDRTRVGGKAVGCAQMLRQGYPVPKGFVLTTSAFVQAWKEAGLLEERTRLLSLFTQTSSENILRKKCAEFQEKIRKTPFSGTVSDSLLSAFSFLGKTVAVRSSATAEDSEISAFAGVYHSVLSVSEEGLLPAVITCWAEAHSYAALTHALRKNIDPNGIEIALLVQDMVNADRSGVLFTQDPTGSNPDSALLSVSKGIGEALLKGEVQGETIRVSRTEPENWDPGFAPLIKSTLSIEKKMGHPQDIEWAIQDGKLWFLQTRPITTLEPHRQKPITWTREISEERFPTPISPLGWSGLRVVLRANHKTLSRRFGLVAKHPEEIARTIRNYVYTNKDFFDIPGSLRPNPLKQIRFLPRYLKGALEMILLTPKVILGKEKISLKYLATSRLFNAFIFTHAREILTEWNRDLPEMLEEMEACAREDLSEMTPQELRAHYSRIEQVADRYMESDIAIYVVKVACSWLLEKTGKELYGEITPDFLSDLTSAMEGNRTLQMNMDLEQLFEQFRKDPHAEKILQEQNPAAFRKAMKAETREAFDLFLQENGHMTTNWDLKEPTWGENPSKVSALLYSYSRANQRKSFLSRHHEQKERYRKAREKIQKDLSSMPWLETFFNTLHETLLDFMRIDEEHHFYCSRLFKPMRAFCFEAGKRLSRTRIIEQSEDIFYLTLPEIFEALEAKSLFPRRYLVEARRADFARSTAVRPPDCFRDQAPFPVDGKPEAAGHPSHCRGVGASPGVATGKIRVVEKEEDAAQLQEGEILVTATPNPAWTPMYAVASGMITSTGSQLSHGLVSAREYHLPAVIGISNATNRFITGQKVTIDGDQGTVSLQ